MERRKFLTMAPAAAATVAATPARSEAGRAGRIDAREFGAKGDGVHDDSSALQAAIDRLAASGGGVLELPTGEYRCVGLALKPKVDLRGLQNRTLLRASGPGTMLTVAPEARQVTVEGLSFRGLTEARSSLGLMLNGIGNFVTRCDFEGFADEAIVVAEGGLVHHLRDIFADNCLRRPERGAVRGVLTISAHDCTLYNVEIAGGLGARLGQVLEPGDGNWCIYIQGSNTFVTDCVAEVGQGGIRIAAGSQQNRIANTRSDLHARHGWLIEGTRSQFSNCIALNCGLEGMHRDAPVGWPGWALAASSHNSLTNCRSHLESYRGKITHGFEEFGVEQGPAASNTLVGCTSLGHSLSAFATRTAGPVCGNNLHCAAEWPGEEIDVTNLGVLELLAQAPKTIANFHGAQGQRLVVVGVSAKAFVTLRHGAGIKMRAGQDLLLQPEAAHEFVKVRNVWRQLS